MGHKHQEITEDRVTVSIVTKDRHTTVPDFAGKMVLAAIKETCVRGQFSFHVDSTDPSMPLNGGPHMTVFDQGQAIGVRMRCGEEEKNTVRGRLFLPKGEIPAVVKKKLSTALLALNDEWSEYGIPYKGMEQVGSVAPATSQPAALPPVSVPEAKVSEASQEVATPSVSSPAVLPERDVASPGSAEEPPHFSGGDDMELALGLAGRAGKNAVIPGHVIRHYLQKKFPGSSKRTLVSETVDRLEERRILRRVRIEDTGEWQFTEGFLYAHNLLTESYTPLPEVTRKRPVSRSIPREQSPKKKIETAPARPASAPLAPSLVPPGEEGTYRKVLEQLLELRRLNREIGLLEDARQKTVAELRRIDDEATRLEQKRTEILAFVTGDGVTKLVTIGSSS